MLTIGIDFGTTNCSAAVYRCGRTELIPLEDNRTILPSTICITREQEVCFGREAIERYLSLTGETRIRYRLTDLRELSSAYSGGADGPMIESGDSMVTVSTVGCEEELDTAARLFQSLKTGLRDAGFHGTTVYDRYYAIEELIALVLGHIRQRAEEYLGEPVEAAVIGRPVSYTARGISTNAEEVDRAAHERMLVAARNAGFARAALEFEPVAAARHLRASLPDRSTALVFDFGGGTLDLALARLLENRTPEIIATRGVLLGGDDFDSAIMEHSVLNHFGKGTTLSPKRLAFPENLLVPLLHWQTIPLLATPTNVARIAALKRQSNAPGTIGNLQTVVRQGLGFRLFQQIESAKIRLSEAHWAQIALCGKGLNIEKGLNIRERISRGAFEKAIADHLVGIEKALREMLQEIGAEPKDVDAVLMTGGSSLVPAVQRTVGHVFAADRVRVADPFTSIAAGLGIIAAEDDLVFPLDDVVSSATQARIEAERVTIGERVAFQRGHQTVEGLVVRRAGGRLHDAILTIEFWDEEIEQFVSTMRHETKIQRLEAK